MFDGGGDRDCGELLAFLSGDDRQRRKRRIPKRESKEMWLKEQRSNKEETEEVALRVRN